MIPKSTQHLQSTWLLEVESKPFISETCGSIAPIYPPSLVVNNTCSNSADISFNCFSAHVSRHFSVESNVLLISAGVSKVILFHHVQHIFGGFVQPEKDRLASFDAK